MIRKSCNVKCNFMMVAVFIVLFGEIDLYANGEQDIKFPDTVEYRMLGLEEQFYYYLKCEPPVFGYPTEDLYVRIIVQENDCREVFSLAKEYALNIEFALDDNGVDLRDYRFDLLLSLFLNLDDCYEFDINEKNWLMDYYESNLIQYIKNEKILDHHVTFVAYGMAVFTDSVPMIDHQEWYRIIYRKYIQEMQIIPATDVSIPDGIISNP